MFEQTPETPVNRVCPLVSVLQSSPRLPESLFSSNVAFCSETCEGMKTEPRNIGSIVLPRFFDRVYCDNTQ